MKNLAHLILIALFASQLLVAGIARASITPTTTSDQKSHVNAMPETNINDDLWVGF